MRTSTLLLVDLALRHGGVRAAARASGASISTISAGIARFEDSQSLALMRRTGTGLVPTVASARLAPAISRMAGVVRALHGLPADRIPDQPVTLSGLFRMAEAVRCGAIRRAAAVMGISQPQLTRQVAQIEANLGQTLLRRQPGGIAATAEGRRVLELIEQLEAEWRAFSGEIEPVHSLASRRFSLGSIIPATARGALSGFVAGLVARLYFDRGLTIQLASAIAEELLAGLDSGRFDAVLIDTELPDPGYRQHTLSCAPVALIGHDLPDGFGDPAALMEALARRPFVLQSPRSGLRQRAERFLDRHAAPDWRRRIPVIEIDSLPVIVNMVAGGRFNSVLPLHVSSGLPAGMTRPLPAAFDQRVRLTWRRAPRMERFAQAVIAAAASGADG